MMMRIAILGGNGQLGQAFGRIVSEYDWADMVRTDLPETDICDPESVRRALAGADAVVNCAAWTAVDDAELHPQEAERINRDGARIVAHVAAELDVAMVHISTDYVFDGQASEPIPESAETDPLGVYGLTKLAGEEAVAASGARSAIIRTAWLYSEFGNNFVKTMLRVGRERGEVRVVDDQTGSPTYAVDLARAIMWLIRRGIGQGREIYHYTNGGATTWCGFAREIFRLTGERVTVHPVSTAEYPTLARRPKYSVLDTTKLSSLGLVIPQWEEALKRCLKECKV